MIVQVQHRRGDALYINDGVYGALAMPCLGFRYPVRLIRPDGPAAAGASVGYSFFGPTCDSADDARAVPSAG